MERYVGLVAHARSCTLGVVWCWAAAAVPGGGDEWKRAGRSGTRDSKPPEGSANVCGPTCSSSEPAGMSSRLSVREGTTTFGKLTRVVGGLHAYLVAAGLERRHLAAPLAVE